VFKDGPVQKHVTAIQKDGKNWFPGNQFETKEAPFIDLYKEVEKKYASIYEPGIYTLTWSDGSKEIVSNEKPLAEKNLSGRWEVHFDPKWGGPEKVEIDELKSWIKFSDPGIKYYSGTARYIKSFSLTKKNINAKLVILDIGNVQEMASVKINGHQTQVVWNAPFRFNITPFVKARTNMLEVEVVNLWPNRLIGDSKLPENQRLTRTNINKFNGKDAENYLRESGLLGPVKINIINRHNLK
ncbi:MAG: glycoside hydrolase family 2, partial [Bacteroidia bacterium]|nr:glycoside hydrolase family 2 [Bacteroidia bacterium]